MKTGCLMSLLAVLALLSGCTETGENSEPPAQESQTPATQEQVSQTAAAPPPTVTAIAEQEYKPVHPPEIACAFKDYNYEGVVAEGGAVKPVGGSIGEFHCGLGLDADSKKIDLAVNAFEDGGVVTEDFGIVQVRFSSSLTSDGYMLMMTDEQKEKIRVFLAN